MQTDKSLGNYWELVYHTSENCRLPEHCSAHAFCSLLQYLIPFPKPSKLRMEHCAQSWCSSFSVFIFVNRTGSCQSSERGWPVPCPWRMRMFCLLSWTGQGNCQGGHSWLAFLKPRAHLYSSSGLGRPSGHRTAPLSCRCPRNRDVLSTYFVVR